MNERVTKMPGDTSEEGYPRVNGTMPEGTVSPIRLRRRYRVNNLLEDKENGETTGQRVVVIRRSRTSPLGMPESDTRLLGDRWYRRVSLHFDLVALRHTMPSFKYTHPTCPKGKCAAGPLEPDKERNLFRIPFNVSSAKPETKDQPKQKIINISIWKEYFFADNIFEMNSMTIQAVRKKRHSECFMSKKVAALQNYIPLFYLKVIALVLFMIKCFFCKISAPIFMYYRSHKHAMIHRTCEEKGVRPVFTGSACHGPIIYSIREISCQYCQAQRESDTTLRLLEILNQERRDRLVT